MGYSIPRLVCIPVKFSRSSLMPRRSNQLLGCRLYSQGMVATGGRLGTSSYGTHHESHTRSGAHRIIVVQRCCSHCCRDILTARAKRGCKVWEHMARCLTNASVSICTTFCCERRQERSTIVSPRAGLLDAQEETTDTFGACRGSFCGSAAMIHANGTPIFRFFTLSGVGSSK